jgi:hypothetical protein
MLKTLVFIVFTGFAFVGFLQPAGFAQATAPATQSVDAAPLYQQAAKLIRDNYDAGFVSPAGSNIVYPNYPPFSPEWQTMEKPNFPANAPARALAHQASSTDRADWPTLKIGTELSYPNGVRAVANEVGDAAVYEHLQGDDFAAIESIRDIWHLADLIEDQPKKYLVCLLVSTGIRALTCDRLEIITSNIALTKDPQDTKDLQIDAARDLISQLLKHPDAKTVVDIFRQDEPAVPQATIDRVIETQNRVNAERDMAAISLACPLYRLDNGKWPKSLDDVKTYLPIIPIDPYGDGKQTIGYAMIKAGLPDGSDRPLVYSRGNMKDGLFFRLDEPEYGYYIGDGSARPPAEQKQGGEFRDVASWAPKEGANLAATTQPVG